MAKSLSIIIPILNEEEQLPVFFNSIDQLARLYTDIEWIFVDGGSEDRSIELIQSFVLKAKMDLIIKRFQSPSIAKGVRAGLDYCLASTVLVLPVDCHIKRVHLDLILGEVDSLVWGGFYKSYTSTNWYYRLYAYLQNLMLTRFGQNIVWTNLLIAKKTLWQQHLEVMGFLEDVFFCDKLKAHAPGCLFKKSVKVSNRRYQGHFFTRIRKNLVIMILYRLGFTDIDRLKKIYSKT
jgi:glycosyltransferase involved in cell wall biosynthesis